MKLIALLGREAREGDRERETKKERTKVQEKSLFCHSAMTRGETEEKSTQL